MKKNKKEQNKTKKNSKNKWVSKKAQKKTDKFIFFILTFYFLLSTKCQKKGKFWLNVYVKVKSTLTMIKSNTYDVHNQFL